ncbi:molybdate ABC transporter substrate-binding protein [Robiginitalea sp.]|nr:molybdate ABC transporter substrate-binding protein [Robiginitalea sp.]
MSLKTRAIPSLTTITGIRGFALLALGLWLLGSCAPQNGNRELTVAVAANMQFAMAELAEAFTQSSGIPCHVTLSSSGKLAAQIREGAPYDVFVSADMAYPEALYGEGFSNNPPKIYAYGKLVLWTLRDSIEPNLEQLLQSNTSHIALANPETAPYGAAAREVLEGLGIWEAMSEKWVYGESIAQVNQFVYSGAAEMGFTAMAAVQSHQTRGMGRWKEVPQDRYSPIAQGAILLNGPAASQPSGQVFFDYLFSDSAAAILMKFGYEIPKKPATAIH